MVDELESTRTTDVGPGDVFVEGEHYRVTYRDVIDSGATRTFTGQFVRYVDSDDLCIFYEDSSVHLPRAITWSTEMVTVEALSAQQDGT